jgi:hypothetical protein
MAKILIKTGFLFSIVFIVISCEFNTTPNVKDQKKTGWAIDKSGDSVYMRYNDKGHLESYSTYKNGLKNGIAKNFTTMEWLNL